MAYKIGDEVLVRAKIVDTAFSTAMERPFCVNLRPHTESIWVSESSIHGPAPKLETDWTKVPMGARVRVRDGRLYEWQSARLIGCDARCTGARFLAVTDEYPLEPDWYAQCELVEEGDE